jgi:plastocyanin
MSSRLQPLLSILFVSTLSLAAVGCDTEEPAPPTTDMVSLPQNGAAELRAIDDCDPVTFGALCNPAFNGGTTLDSFFAQLTANQQVGAWKYSSAVNVKPGRPVNVVSRGGEGHTFTVVQNFGGGKVPILNDLSGNPVPAPECLQAANAKNLDVASGSTQAVTTGPGGTLPVGHYRVQCCIHPWMRTEIDVTN